MVGDRGAGLLPRTNFDARLEPLSHREVICHQRVTDKRLGTRRCLPVHVHRHNQRLQATIQVGIRINKGDHEARDRAEVGNLRCGYPKLVVLGGVAHVDIGFVCPTCWQFNRPRHVHTVSGRPAQIAVQN